MIKYFTNKKQRNAKLLWKYLPKWEGILVKTGLFTELSFKGKIVGYRVGLLVVFVSMYEPFAMLCDSHWMLCLFVCWPCLISPLFSIILQHDDRVRCDHCKHRWTLHSTGYNMNNYNCTSHIDESSGLPSGLLAIES